MERPRTCTCFDHRRGPEQPIVDALHIYNAADERDGDPMDLQIVWAADGQAAALLLDGVAVAMADFAAPRFMCRSEFPPPTAEAPVQDARLGPGGLRRALRLTRGFEGCTCPGSMALGP